MGDTEVAEHILETVNCNPTTFDAIKIKHNKCYFHFALSSNNLATFKKECLLHFYQGNCCYSCYRQCFFLWSFVLCAIIMMNEMLYYFILAHSHVYLWRTSCLLQLFYGDICAVIHVYVWV